MKIRTFGIFCRILPGSPLTADTSGRQFLLGAAAFEPMDH